jgi:hypothetical protein
MRILKKLMSPERKKIIKLFKDNKIEDANYLITKMIKSNLKRVRYAVYAAESVVNIYKEKYPDDHRPSNAIKSAKKFLKNPNQKTRDKTSVAVADAFSAVSKVYGEDPDSVRNFASYNYIYDDATKAAIYHAANSAAQAANTAADLSDDAISSANAAISAIIAISEATTIKITNIDHNALDDLDASSKYIKESARAAEAGAEIFAYDYAVKALAFQESYDSKIKAVEAIEAKARKLKKKIINYGLKLIEY